MGSAARRTRRRSSTSTGSARTRDGQFLWPGFGENLRVLLWMIDRVQGRAAADGDADRPRARRRRRSTGTASRSGRADRQALLQVDREEWAAEVPEIRAFFDRFGDRLPAELDAPLAALEHDLAKVTA